MEILASLTAFPAYVIGVLLLAVIADLLGSLKRFPIWLKLMKRALLFTALVSFLFLSYTFLLSTALSINYLYFVSLFTVLFGFTSFFIPRVILTLLGRRMQWFARSVASFGYAFVLLTFAALLVKELPLSRAIPKPVILAIAFISLSLFVLPRLIRARAESVHKSDPAPSFQQESGSPG
jgi:hypothetical protein